MMLGEVHINLTQPSMPKLTLFSYFVSSGRPLLEGLCTLNEMKLSVHITLRLQIFFTL
jgi:hypothetical protein